MGVIPTRMMPMGAWRDSAPPLPYDAEVEYVESTGAQYVDTGVVASSDLGIDCSISFPVFLASYQGVFISSEAVVRYEIGLQTNQNRVLTFLGAGTVVVVTKAFSQKIFRFVVDTGTRTASIDDTTASWSGVADFSTNLPFALFGYRTQSGTTNQSARVYGCAMFDRGTLVRDFVPVRVGTAGYLYDRANPTGGPLGNGLYGSETSTPLVAGPDK